ncbi:hypothetical protein GUITHDRAFT_100239 [Guillardia theta CCMP2712]|uniref:PH domain-containing protein n=1 Tax=Guillardia theta (strain CCMP2712) TaxID=905079 RepID=L1K0U3_GUITC|nr:hypothetical protein GUITHDRAFT_100239 [Guillardia theta CCMP2712]EKX53988.1 hypothetical protein GUITHDRAFT_100239 [Guillardia theta CCMP2712]|eukprot:XP_005840968.1 hypothetical protein GUITHDRAFT_100239 [Guillardia theta CCMP2712]
MRLASVTWKQESVRWTFLDPMLQQIQWTSTEQHDAGSHRNGNKNHPSTMPEAGCLQVSDILDVSTLHNVDMAFEVYMNDGRSHVMRAQTWKDFETWFQALSFLSSAESMNEDNTAAQETRSFNQASGLNAEANKKISAGKLGGSARKAVDDVTAGKSWDDQDMLEISGRRAPIDQFSDLSSERGSDRGEDPMDKPKSSKSTAMDLKFLKFDDEDGDDEERAGSQQDRRLEEEKNTPSELPDEIYLKELRKVHAYQADKRAELESLMSQLRRNRERNKALRRRLELQNAESNQRRINDDMNSVSETVSVASSTASSVNVKIEEVRKQLKRSEAMNLELWREIDRMSMALR